MGKPRTSLLVVWVLAVLLAACAAPRPQAPTSPTFSEQAALATIAAGYTNIAEKYLDPVNIGDLAVEGMRGLGAIDPAITVHREAGSVVLVDADNEVARFAAPGDDPNAWAGLTVQVAAAAQAVSPAMRAADIEQIYEAVFDGVLSKLDRFSRYAGRDEAKRNRDDRNGFGGVGIRFRVKDEGIQVTAVIEDTPAERVGLKAGDLITRVDGAPMAGLDSKKVAARLRGPIQTRVLLTVVRAGKPAPFDVAVWRGLVISTTVHTRFADGVLVVDVTRFNSQTAESLDRDLRRTLREHPGQVHGIVLDLRGNRGGIMRQGVVSADLFVEHGDILRTRGRHPATYQLYVAHESELAPNVPLVVLIDGGSASTAEITASALQDLGRALVVGTTSFGKGVVQTVIRLPNDGELTLTWSRFITPSGYALHGLGVHPTVCTSGMTTRSPDPVPRVLAEHDDAAILAAWRTVGLTDEARRQELRAVCPAENRRDDALDLDLARRLAANPKLYAQLLNLTATATASTAAVPQ